MFNSRWSVRSSRPSSLVALATFKFLLGGALFGGLIIGMIANGIDLVGYSDAVKYVITGLILLAAVTLDTVARRRQLAAGR